MRIAIRGKGSFAASSRTARSPSTWRRPTTDSRVTIVPHDIYVGNLITALGCIDAGITCVIDNSHNSRSAAHSDAAVQALIDSGIRGVHASGAPQTGEWDRQWPQDLERLQKRFFASTDQLVTLRMFSGMRP